jgi:hypothetical protein
MALHLIKLCVGIDSIEALQAWRRATQARDPDWKVHTRQTPKRAEELVEGGSLYRVIKGAVVCRQAILRIDTVGSGPASRCEIVLDPHIVRTAPMPRRAFQGWRYLEAKDAPEDLETGGLAESLPTELAVRLRELGAW